LLKLIFRLLLSLIIGTLCLALLALAILQNTYRKRIDFKWAVERFDAREGILLEAKEIKGFLPFYLTAKQIRLTEQKQTWLEAESLTIHCSPLSLLWRHIDLPSDFGKCQLSTRHKTPPRPFDNQIRPDLVG